MSLSASAAALEAVLAASEEPAALDALLEAPAVDEDPPQAAKLRAMAAVRNRDTAFFNFLILNSS